MESRRRVCTNSPAAHCSSSAPFSQSRSPSQRHDNETHLLAAPPQSNFSGGHVCRPVVVFWKVEVMKSGGGGDQEEGGSRWKSGRNERESGRGGRAAWRVRKRRGRDGARRDSQSMKLFDNLVIYVRQSIPPGEPQLKETPSDKGTRKHFQADERLRPNSHPSTHTQKHTITWVQKHLCGN